MLARVLQSGRFGILQNLSLRQLWIVELWASAAESLGMIAFPLIVYDRTNSAQMVGFISLLLILPRVLLAPITGLMADNLDRRTLMKVAFIERAFLVALIPLTTSVSQIGVIAVGVSIGNAIARPAELSAIPAIVDGHTLVRALSLIQVTNGIIRIAVPAAGAALIATTGPEPIFLIQAAGYLCALWAVRALVIPRGSTAHQTMMSMVRSAKAEMWAGLAALRSVPIVRGVTATESLFQFAGGALVVAGVVYTEETLQLGDRAETAFALMTAAMSAGAVLGAVIASRIERRIGRPRMLAIGYLGPGFLLIALATPQMPVIYLFWFLFGMADAWAVISFQAYLAESIPAHLRGRVYAAWGAVVSLAAAISFPVVGFVTSAIGAPATFGLAGAIVGLGGPSLLWATGALESIRHHRPVADLAISPEQSAS